MMDWTLFREMLEQDSTSGRERPFAEWLEDRLEAPAKQRFEVGDGTLNLLFSWGTPQVVFCTHMDTVPPYLPPVFTDEAVRGRGSCDAKGQIFAMYTACKALEAAGASGFGLLLLSGEETGSFGAKAFSGTDFRAPFLVVGEPTELCLVSASKGTKSFGLRFAGEAFHSGYPEHGASAVNRFLDFMEALRAADFGDDPVLGNTTWNVGELRSDNPQNILSPELTCRLYFRTTFVSDRTVCDWMASAPARFPGLEVTARGGDTPQRYVTLEGIPSKPVAFGSDAPHLAGFGHKLIFGPGSVTVAHRPDEFVRKADLETAVDLYIRIFRQLSGPLFTR